MEVQICFRRIDLCNDYLSFRHHNNTYHFGIFLRLPADIHFAALHYILRYYRGTLTKGLTFWRRHPLKQLPIGTFPTTCRTDPNFPFPENPFHLCTYFDTSYASHADLHRRSIGGILGVLGGTAIYGKTKKHSTVAISSTESEFTTSCM